MSPPIRADHIGSLQRPRALLDEIHRIYESGHTALVVAGVITNNSVEATVRKAGNLGFAVWLVEDACFTFGRMDWNGVWRSAKEVHAMSLANLDGEYCTVISGGAWI